MWKALAEGAHALRGKNLVNKWSFGAVALATLAAPTGGILAAAIPTADAATFARGSGQCVEVATVQSGDWLSKIAPQTWRDIAATNHVRNPNLIFPGERFCITAAEAHALHGAGAFSVGTGGKVTPPAKPVLTHPTSPANPAPPASGGPAAPPASGGNGSPPTPPAHQNPTVPVSGSVLGSGPCAGQNVDFSNAGEWNVPHGCYGGIYTVPNLGYPSYGWCNYMPEYTHPWLHGTAALNLPDHGSWAPRVNATEWFNGGVAGASSDGHYGVVVAVGPNGWVLSVEMNFYWRGGGFGKVIYRFIHLQPGLTFRY